MVRTIEEISKLIKEGKENEITTEEWKAIDGIIEIYIAFMKSICKQISKV